VTFDDDLIEEALAALLDQWKDTPLTTADLRRETIQFVSSTSRESIRRKWRRCTTGLFPNEALKWA
jgi:hypothetical protein